MLPLLSFTPQQWLLVGNALKALRIDAGLDQEEAAVKIGISCSYLSQVERGRPVGIETVERLLVGYGAGTDALFVKILSNHTLSAPDRNLFDSVRSIIRDIVRIRNQIV
jgi:transcriptional regulator with XRE-family HTH domain